MIGIVFMTAVFLQTACLWSNSQFGKQLWGYPWIFYFVLIVLLYIGIKIILYRLCHNRDQWLKRPIPLNEDGKRICCSAQFGGDEYVFNGESFKGARLDVFCGGIRLDLREAVIKEDEEIDIHTFLGGIELLVPYTVNIEIKSRSLIGGVGNHTVKANDPVFPCIHIIASNILGGVSIKNH